MLYLDAIRQLPENLNPLSIMSSNYKQKDLAYENYKHIHGLISSASNRQFSICSTVLLVRLATWLPGTYPGTGHGRAIQCAAGGVFSCRLVRLVPQAEYALSARERGAQYPVRNAEGGDGAGEGG